MPTDSRVVRMEERLQGELRFLPHVLQLLTHSNETGSLQIHSGSGDGVLSIRSGKVLWAEFPPFLGEEAVYVMLSQKEGTFCFVPNDPHHDKEVNVFLSTTHLLLEAARLADEMAHYTAMLESENAAEEGISDGHGSVPAEPPPAAPRAEPEPAPARNPVRITGKKPEPSDIRRESAMPREPQKAAPRIHVEPAYGDDRAKRPPEVAAAWNDDWWGDAHAFCAKVADCTRVKAPAQWMEPDRLVEILEQGQHSRALLLAGGQDLLESVFGACAERFDPTRLSGDRIPVLRFAAGRQVLYITGSPEGEVLRRFSTSPCVVDVRKREIVTALRTISEWGHPATVFLTDDPKLLGKESLTAAAHPQPVWRYVVATMTSPLMICVTLQKTLRALAAMAAQHPHP